VSNTISRGKCSVPMWTGFGMPAGVCRKDAYGKQVKSKRIDGDAYASDLACPIHAGPKRHDVLHRGDPCKYCGIPHDDVPIGPCEARQ